MSIAYILISKTYSLAQALDFMRGMSFRTDQLVEIPEGYKFVICYDNGQFMNKKTEVKPGIDFYYFDYNRPIARPPIPRVDNMDISPENFQKGQTREQVKIDTQRLKELYKGLVDYAGIPTISKTKQQMVKNAMDKADILQSLEPEISTADVAFPQNVDYYIDKIRSLILDAELTPGAHEPGPHLYLSDPTLDIYKEAEIPGLQGPKYRHELVPEIKSSFKTEILPQAPVNLFDEPISETSDVPLIPKINYPGPPSEGEEEEDVFAAPEPVIKAKNPRTKKLKLSTADKKAIAAEMTGLDESPDESFEEIKKSPKKSPKKSFKIRHPEYSGIKKRGRPPKGHGLLEQIGNTRYNPNSLI